MDRKSQMIKTKWFVAFYKTIKFSFYVKLNSRVWFKSQAFWETMKSSSLFSGIAGNRSVNVPVYFADIIPKNPRTMKRV